MRVVKRMAGVLALFFGSVGVLACLAGFAGTWVVRARMDAVVGNVVDRVDVASSKLEERTSQANERIDSTRDSCRRLNQRVQQRVADLRHGPAEDAPDIDEIERQLYARMQLGRDWIGFVRSGVDMVDQVLQMLGATSLFGQEEPQTRADIVAAVRAGQEEIEEALKLADEVKTHLENIRAHRDLDENATQIRTLSSRIDASLEKVQRFGADLEAGIAQLRIDAANLGTRIRRQILIVAVIANLLLFWLAASQASLAIHGWCLLRS